METQNVPQPSPAGQRGPLRGKGAQQTRGEKRTQQVTRSMCQGWLCGTHSGQVPRRSSLSCIWLYDEESTCQAQARGRQARYEAVTRTQCEQMVMWTEKWLWEGENCGRFEA